MLHKDGTVGSACASAWYRHVYSKTLLIHSWRRTWIRYALSDVLINRQWQMSGYRLTSQKKKKLILTQTHTQTSFIWEQAARNFHLPPWWPCHDGGILKLCKATSQQGHEPRMPSRRSTLTALDNEGPSSNSLPRRRRGSVKSYGSRKQVMATIVFWRHCRWRLRSRKGLCSAILPSMVCAHNISPILQPYP